MAAQNIESICRLTPLQEGILFHTLEDAASGVYFEQYACTLRGRLDTAVLRRAWEAAVARHAVLRTLFTWEKRDKPLQIVRQRVTLPFEALDWRDLDESTRGQRLASWLRLDRDRGFDLEKAPLTRIALIRMADDAWRMIWSFHHLLIDGWSMRLILDQVLADYETLTDGGVVSTDAPAFADFVAWLERRDEARERRFFRDMLAGFDEPTCPDPGPSGRDPHRVGDPNGTHEHSVDDTLYERLKSVARERRLTLNTLITGAWAILLARHTGRNDVVFGTTLSGRPPELSDAEKTAGLFINTLPLRVTLNDDATIADTLQAVQRRQVDMREVAQTPLTVARRASDVPAGTALFETIVVFENFPARDGGAQRRLTLADEHYVEYSNFPLALLAVPAETLTLYAVHDPRRFGAAAAARMLRQLETLLAGMLADPDRPVGELALADAATLKRVTREWNDTEVDFGPAEPVHRLIERRARAAPDAVALVDASGETRYGELDARAGRLARRLLAEGVRPGQPVVVFAERGAPAVIGILAALKAGAAYVPMDASYPAERLRLVLDDLTGEDPPLVLTRAHLRERVAAAARVIDLDDEAAGDAGADTAPDVDPAQAAYLIYTSGSTGRPKGVVVSHANLFNSTRARDRYYGEAPQAWLLLSSLATDSSIAGLFWTLASGARLVLPASRAEQDMDALAALIRDAGVSHLLCVPSLHALILETADPRALSGLRAVIVAGEACPPALVDEHHERLPRATLYNEYGPSEATVWASVAKLAPGEAVTIGGPIANTRLYVLDPAMRPLPEGVAGELYIGGANVARGYHQRPERTAAAFVADPFAASPSARLYRTGDKVRWRADGKLEFVGRVDQQIKVRGFRVEPGEIENLLATDPRVDEAVVVVDGGGRLLACLRAGVEPDPDTLRALCREHLPEHMVPQRFVILEALPRTPSGKIDRAALAADTPAALAAGPDAAPANETEARLAAIWAAVLGVDRVGAHDDFFEAGGDSLLSIRILSRAAKDGLRITPEDFFAHPTVAGQAARATVAGETRAEQGLVTGELPLMPVQHWFFDAITRDAHHWNQSLLFRVTADIDPHVLERAVQRLLLHHDALRSRFERRDDRWAASIAEPGSEPPLTLVDLVDADAATRRARMAEHAAELNASFDPARPPLIRFALFRCGDGEDRLLITAHHLVVDAVSWHLLVDDLEALCLALADGRAPKLPAKTTSMRDWARRLAAYADEPALTAEAPFWLARRDAAGGRVPVDGERTAGMYEGEADSLVVGLDAETTARLGEALGRRLRARMVDALVSALARVLATWIGARTVRFDTEGHGREALFEDLDVSRTVGWFTSVFPLTLRAGAAADWRDPAAALRLAKDARRELPNRGIGFGLLRAYGRDDESRALRDEPPPDVLFNYLGRAGGDGDEQRLLQLAEPVFGPARSTSANRAYLLEINARLADGRLVADWRYNPGVHSRETIARLADEFLAALTELAGDEIREAGAAHTPSDFPLAGLDQGELDNLSDLLGDLD